MPPRRSLRVSEAAGAADEPAGYHKPCTTNMKRCWMSTKKTESGLYSQFTPYIQPEDTEQWPRAVAINAAAILSLLSDASLRTGEVLSGAEDGRVQMVF
jgi:hypothetical protein